MSFPDPSPKLGDSDNNLLFKIAQILSSGAPPPPPLDPPDAPSNLTVTPVSDSELTLNWVDNADNETGFRIERSTDGMNFSEVAVVGANVITFLDSGLAALTTYFYQVRAFNLDGVSGYSNIASDTTMALPPEVSILDDLLAYYRLEGEDGNAEWPDEGPNGLHMSMVGFPGDVPGHIGDCLISSGGGEYLTRTDAAFAFAGSFSISIWAYQDNNGADSGLAARGIDEWTVEYLSGQGYGFYANGVEGAQSLTIPASAVWTHIIAQYEVGVGLSIIVDGVTTGPVILTGIPGTPNTFNLGIGVVGFQNGRLDEIGIWPRLLTAVEQAWLYNGGAGNQVI